MSYVAFELATGEAKAEIESLCRHAARGSGGTFTSNTVPSLGAVERWLTTSYYWIQGQLRRSGLSSTQTATPVLGQLQQLQVYDVCCKVELSLPVDSTSGDPSARFQWFETQRKEMLETLHDGTLAGLGAATYDGGVRTPYAGGLSNSRKRLIEDNADATQHRVRRGGFVNVGGAGPWAESDVAE